MEQKFFANNKELARYMIYQNKCGHYIAAVMYFDRAQDLIREILKNDEVSIGYLDIENAEWMDYVGEYVVEMLDGYVSASPAWHMETEHSDAGFYKIEACEILLDGEVDSAIIPFCMAPVVYELCFEDEMSESDCGETHDECNCHKCNETIALAEAIDAIFESFFGIQ